MPTGIRTTVEFATPDICPVTELSGRIDGAIYSRSTSVAPLESIESVSEFTVEATEGKSVEGREPIISYGSTHRYRVCHGEGVNCPCECLGKFGCPVERYVARDGVLTLVFHASDYEELQDIVAELRERYPAVDIKRLVRGPTEGEPRDDVFVDRSKLTNRQLEVLQTAYEMGYFERPRRANATEIAEALDIDQSTFSEHLAAAQAKLFDDLLEDGT
ncbi:MAG: helix-turn-helix domain-containing protein [Halobacteriota archaeon]